MNSRSVAPCVALAAIAMTALAMPASGATSGRPRPGTYSGSIGKGGPPGSLGFAVTKKHPKAKDFIGTVPVGANCKRNVAGYALPAGAAPIHHGHFKLSSNDYVGHPQVSISGTFTSRTKVRGHVQVKFKNSKGCNARTVIHASRVKPGAPGGA